MSKRREFLKNSTGLLLGSIFLPDFLEAKNTKELLTNRQLNGIFASNLLFGDPVIVTNGPNEIIIQAHSLFIDGNIFKNQVKSLYILCYDLRINGDIEVVNGRNIQISCVNLIPTRDVAIISKGIPGEPAGKDLDGQSTGQAGRDGDNFITDSNAYRISGAASGQIKINYSTFGSNFMVSVISQGGAGAKGEDGGNGYKGGGIGETGSDAPVGGQPQEGRQGQTGGNGGNGAKGGDGGAGGRIEINQFLIPGQSISNLVQRSNFRLASIGGQPGLGGVGGEGGNGGPGGPGGRYGYWRTVNRGGGGGPQGGGPDIDQVWSLRNNRAGSGPQGLKGSKGKNGEPGLIGKSGTVHEGKIDINELSKNLTVSYLKLLMLKAESLYINNKVNEAAAIFLLIVHINEDGLNNATNQLYYNLSKFSFTGQEEKSQLIQKAENYLQRIRLSLDFWGKSLNYVPRIKKDYLKSELNSLVSMAVSFENVINKFYDKESLTAKQLEEIKETRQKHADLINSRKRDFDQKKQFTFYVLQEEIRQSNEDIERRKGLLERSDINFKNAVKKRNQKKCGFTEVISAVQMVVSIGTAVSSFGAGLVSSVNAVNTFNQLNASSDDTLKGVWGVVKGMEKVTKEAADSLSGGYTALEKVEENYSKIFEKQKEDLAVTTNLIELETQDFEKLMDKYIDMPEARQYKAEMRQYVNAINARNKKRLDYTNNILELDKIRLEIELQESEQQKFITTEFMSASAQSPGELQLLMLNQYYIVRGQIIRLIFLLERSIEFYSLQSRQLSFLDTSIASLQTNIIDSRIRDLENDSALGNGLNLFPNTARVTLNKNSHPLIFASFNDDTKDYAIDFYISPDDVGFLGEYSNIRVKNVRVYMDRVRYSGDKLSMKLTHMGNSLINNANGDPLQFMHDSVGITLDYFFRKSESESYNSESYMDNITGTFEDSNKKYSLISPFANWKLVIKNDVNPGVNLKGVRQIILAFDFFAGPRNT